MSDTDTKTYWVIHSWDPVGITTDEGRLQELLITEWKKAMGKEATGRDFHLSKTNPAGCRSLYIDGVQQIGYYAQSVKEI